MLLLLLLLRLTLAMMLLSLQLQLCRPYCAAQITRMCVVCCPRGVLYTAHRRRAARPSQLRRRRTKYGLASTYFPALGAPRSQHLLRTAPPTSAQPSRRRWYR
jgi:hypothetical protein